MKKAVIFLISIIFQGRVTIASTDGDTQTHKNCQLHAGHATTRSVISCHECTNRGGVSAILRQGTFGRDQRPHSFPAPAPVPGRWGLSIGTDL